MLSAGAGDKVTLGVRPEDLELSEHGIPCTVEVVEELGADAYVHGTPWTVDDADQPIIARVDGRRPPEKGEKVHFTPKEGHVHVFDAEQRRAPGRLSPSRLPAPTRPGAARGSAFAPRPVGRESAGMHDEHADASLQITAAAADPALLDLPWRLPLEEWPADRLAALPRGISRHVVRFVRMSGTACSRPRRSARSLARQRVRPAAHAAPPRPARRGAARRRHRPARPPDGTPLDPVLLTRHLQFSLPYRALFSQTLRADTVTRLVDALAVLLVRLHLAGFYWGDVLAVQHAVPARRRRVRGVPGGRRDRRPARRAVPRPARARPRPGGG